MSKADLIDNLTMHLNHAESVMQLLANDFDERGGKFTINADLISNAFGSVIYSIERAKATTRQIWESKAEASYE